MSDAFLHPATLALAALAVVSAHLCIHHLAQWGGRRDKSLSLWISAWAALAAVHLVGRILHWTAPDPSAAVLGMTVAGIAVSFGVVVVVGTAHAITERPPPRWLLPTLAAGAVGLALAHALTDGFLTEADSRWGDAFGREMWWVEPGPLAPLWLLIGVPALIYALLIVWRADHLERALRWGFTGAFAVYGIAGAHDLLVAWLPLDQILWFEFSFAAVAIGLDHLSIRQSNQTWEHLEERVDERTAELEEVNVALRSAAARVEEASEAKGRFLASVSHEIRTPMSGILGLSRQLIRSPLDAGQKQLAETVHQCSITLLAVLDDILDVARMEAGTWRVASRPFGPHRIVEDVCELFAVDADSRGLELVADIPTERDLALVGDPVRFRQVLTNLVGNALRYTDRGEVVVSLRVLREAGAAEVARIEVRDTGAGVPPEELDRLFEPFMPSARTDERGGSGLGLAIARGLVELMDGRIGAGASPAGGSLFWFELPITSTERSDRASLVDKTLAGRRILVAEHREATRRAIAQALRSWGAEVVATDLMMGAVHHVRSAMGEAPFDVVLADVDLPDEDPLDLHDILKQVCGAEAPPIVALTGARGNGPHLDRHFAEAVLLPARQSRLFGAIVECCPGVRAAPSMASLPGALRPGSASAIPTVLVVEDEPINRQVAAMQLEELGYEARLVVSGEEALEALEHERFAAVLMDLRMPGLDGYETSRRVRALETDRRTPIIAVTAHALQEERRRSLDSTLAILQRPARVLDAT